MFFAQFSLFLALGIFPSVFGGPLEGLLGLNSPLQARQGSLNIPTECENACSPVTPLLASQQCSPQQCCTSEFGLGLRDCLLCVGTVMGIQDYTEPQQTLDKFAASCAAQGFQMPSLTLPGQDTNRESSSFNPSTTSTRSQTTITSLPTTSTDTAPTTGPSSQNNGASTLRGTSWLGDISIAIILGLGIFQEVRSSPYRNLPQKLIGSMQALMSFV
uniref:Uncharacterized protein n=1 Tax=Moniliophthora roreri TaxID=221103 RepID=A0A0W0FC71_MONRR